MKKLFIVLAFFCGISEVHAIPYVKHRQTPGIVSPNEEYIGGVRGRRNDLALYENIRQQLHTVYSDKYNGVRISVRKGNVTLRGTIGTEEDKYNVEQSVRGVPGVKNINNQLNIQGYTAPR